MANAAPQPQNAAATHTGAAPATADAERVPLPTAHFRRRAWLEFQRALDPLARPKPLPQQRH